MTDKLVAAQTLIKLNNEICWKRKKNHENFKARFFYINLRFNLLGEMILGII